MWFPPPLRLREPCYPLLPKDIKTIRAIRVGGCVSCYLETSREGSEFNSARCEEGLSACVAIAAR